MREWQEWGWGGGWEVTPGENCMGPPRGTNQHSEVGPWKGSHRWSNRPYGADTRYFSVGTSGLSCFMGTQGVGLPGSNSWC